MTVKDVISYLKCLPDNAEIAVWDGKHYREPNYFGFGEVSGKYVVTVSPNVFGKILE